MESSEDMKICKDCKHFRTPDDYCLCGRDEKYTVDLVLGNKYASGRYHCSDQRNKEDGAACGPEGKFWEQSKDN